MDQQLQPPQALGGGEARWGGAVRPGVALCPLVNLVTLSDEADAAAAREAGSYNARLGRPDAEGGDGTAIRCVAARALPAGTLILAEAPGAAAAPEAGEVGGAAAGDRVRVVQGGLEGLTGVVLRLRAEDQRPIVRLDGPEKKLVVMPPDRLVVVAKGA